MAKNFKIADINRNARYTVATIDNWDGHAERREMTGAELIDFTNAAAHLYDIHAEEIAEPQEAQDTAEIMKQAGAVTLPHRVALYVPGTQGPATATDNTAQVKRVARRFCELFGGATAQQSAGYWMSERAGLVAESVTIVYAACTKAQRDAHLTQVLELAQDIKRDMAQETVSVELDGTLYII